MSFMFAIYDYLRRPRPNIQENHNQPAIEEEVFVEPVETAEEMAERMGAELAAFDIYNQQGEIEPETQSDPNSEMLALLPEFLSFDFDIHNDKVCLKIDLPNYYPDTKEMIEEFGLQIIKDTAIGWVLGGASGVVYGMYKCKNAWRYANLGSTVGSVLGFATGVSRSVLIYIDLHNLAPHLKESASKSQKIIQTLIKNNKNEVLDQGCNINCSISLEVMVYPVKAPCGHVFENFELLKWMNKTKLASCPCCRRKITISELEPDNKTRETIHAIARTSFKQMESILIKLPRRRMGLSYSPTLYSSSIVRYLTEKVKSGESLLQQDESAILEKIEKGTLSCEEAYTVAYYLIKQFKPMNEKIKYVFFATKQALNELFSAQKIDQPTLAKYSSALDLWFASASPITKKDFPILYSLL